MNEAVTKRFLLYFRLMLLVWILIANAIIHVTGLEYSWLIFLSNIMMFTLEGDVKDRFVTVELGGLVGLILTVIALLSITALTPVLGSFFGFLIPLAVVLFILLPTAITGLIGLVVPLPMWLRNLLEGVVKVVIFVGYLILCSRMKDIHRVFQYHGAEHKTIFCYEHGLPLTVENVRVQPRHHPRCGTSFLFVVIVVSILLSSLLFSFIEVTNTFARMGLHLLLLPVIVSLTYEFNRLVGRYDNWFTRIMTAPGMWLQNWTTFEPDDSMIEVGIRAFTLVLPEEQGKDAW